MTKGKKWERFELLAKEIQEELSPDAVVQHNVRIQGKSGSLRQIDILVEQKVGQFDIFIAIDCKDYNRKLDVKHIEEFAGLVQDVGAYKGAMITFLGYTDTAKKRADALGIELFRLVDTESEDWKVRLTIPVYFVEKGVEKWNLSIRSNYNAPLVIPNMDFRYLVFYDESHNTLGMTERYLKEKWNKGELKTTDEKNELILEKVYISDGTSYYPCDLCFTYTVSEKYYKADWRISNLKGFADEKTGKVITKKFTIDSDLDLEEIEKKWHEIKKIEPKDESVLMIFELINAFVL